MPDPRLPPRDMYETTVPFGEPELHRASGFERWLDTPVSRWRFGDGEPPADARISTLSGALRDDLARCAVSGQEVEALDVFAACVRHGRSVTAHLQCGERVVPVTIFAFEHLVHCPIELTSVVGRHLPTLRVLQVEPAVRRPPGDPERSLVAPLPEHHPLPPLLWQVAMRGTRRELLPEIAGAGASYRVAPSLDVEALPAMGAVRPALVRLRAERHTLPAIAAFPGFDRERAERLLNALYLQGGLIVSRA